MGTSGVRIYVNAWFHSSNEKEMMGIGVHGFLEYGARRKLEFIAVSFCSSMWMSMRS